MMTEKYLEDYIECRRCDFVGPEDMVVNHYIREELCRGTAPFSCHLCPAIFHRKQQARIHKNRDHKQRTSPFSHIFYSNLQDLRVNDMVRRPAFLRGNRPSNQHWTRWSQRTMAQPLPEPRTPVQTRLGPRCPSLKCPTEAMSTADHASIPDAENVMPNVATEQ